MANSSYSGICNADTPYPSVSSESVPSLIDNLVTALYGKINKTVINRRVQWNIPCDPATAPAQVAGIPRLAGEGLLCYIIRIFNLKGGGGATPVTLNVTDYGAVGDGITDDTLAIQAAINDAVSIGNAIVEFEPRRYLVATSRANIGSGGYDVGNNYLNIYNGTSSLKISFKGNGATIFDTRTPSQISLFFVKTRFDNITFDGLTLSRDGGISSIFSDNFSRGIQCAEVDATPVGDFLINNCTFNNCHHALHIRNNIAYDRIGKLRSLNVSNCNFLYPFGSNCASPSGGGVIVFNSEWIETARYTGCYADGMIGGKLPSGVSAPKDGFLNVSPLNAIITNCVFKNFGVEGIIGGSLGGNVAINQFTQVAVGSDTTNVTINTMFAGENLITQDEATANGNIQQSWYIINSNWAASIRLGAGATGVYQLKSWNKNTSAGTTLVFTRLADELMGTVPTNYIPIAPSTVVQNTGYGNRLMPFTLLDEYSLTVSESKFYGGEILNTNGTLYCISQRPAIATGIKSTIVNNQFLNCHGSVTTGSATDITSRQSIISNNYFYNNLGYLGSGVVGSSIYAGSQNILVSNNIFSSNGSLNYPLINVQENNISFSGNQFIINNPTIGTYSTACIKYINNDPPFQIISSNNSMVGYDYYIYGQSSNLIDGFNGKELSDNQWGKPKNKLSAKKLTKNGWVRLNANLSGFPATAATIECDRVKFEVTQEGYQDGQINVSRNPFGSGYKSVDAIRLSSSGFFNVCFIDVRVGNFEKISAFGSKLLNVSGSSESGDVNLTDLVESTVITSIQSNGTNSVLITTSSNHGIATGDYVSITGSNSTPSIDGCTMATYVSPTTFTISGYTITVEGNAETITSYTGSGSGSGAVTTVTTATAHTFAAGDDIYISGSTSGNLNGIFTVATPITSNTFTINLINASGTAGNITCAELFNQKTFNTGVNKELKLASNLINQSTAGIGDTSGSGVPASVPVFFGQSYYDTANAKWYKAAGTASSSDWKAIS